MLPMAFIERRASAASRTVKRAMEGERRRMRSGTRSLSRRVRRSRVGKREACPHFATQQAGTRS